MIDCRPLGPRCGLPRGSKPSFVQTSDRSAYAVMHWLMFFLHHPASCTPATYWFPSVCHLRDLLPPRSVLMPHFHGFAPRNFINGAVLYTGQALRVAWFSAWWSPSRPARIRWNLHGTFLSANHRELAYSSSVSSWLVDYLRSIRATLYVRLARHSDYRPRTKWDSCPVS